MAGNRIKLLVDSGSKRFAEGVGALPEAADFEILTYVGKGEEGLRELIPQADAVYIYQHFLPADVIRSAPSLRFIQKHGLNCKNIGLEAAAERGIPVATLQLLRNATVAEQAMALMLACARKVIPGYQAVVGAAYRDFGLTPFRTTQREYAGNWAQIAGVSELKDAAVGIIGLGDIGLEIAKRCKAFDMNIYYHQRQPHSADVEKQYQARFLPFDKLLETVDYLVLILPHNAATEGMIGAKELARMKPSATLINVARGNIVDQAALIDALQSGRLAMAGLDVYSEEPLPDTSPLIGMKNVVLTPHMGGGSGRARLVDRSAGLANILRFFRENDAAGIINGPSDENG
jgi:phosphoglycerate dehydrogenase-like enzyme